MRSNQIRARWRCALSEITIKHPARGARSVPGNFNNEQKSCCYWNRGHGRRAKQNKTAPQRRHPTYHLLWCEEQGCTFCSIMRPRRSCFWAAGGNTARFQFKMIWRFSGNSSDRLNPLLLLLVCLFVFLLLFVVMVFKRSASTIWSHRHRHHCGESRPSDVLSCGEDLGRVAVEL